MQLLNSLLLRRDLLFQLLDTIVQDKFELFELLSLSFEQEDSGLVLSDVSIFLCDLLVEHLDLVAVLGKDLFLLLNSSGLIQNVSLQASFLIFNVLHLILDELQLGFGFESHIVHLALVLLVLLLDGSELLIAILFNLIDRHRVSLD